MSFCYRAVVSACRRCGPRFFGSGKRTSTVDIARCPSCLPSSSCDTVFRIQHHVDLVYEDCGEQRLVDNSAVQEDSHPPVFNFAIKVQAGDQPGT